MIYPRIYCKKYSFQESVPLSGVNLFNIDVVPVSGVKQEITDVIDMSTIKYDHAKVLSGDTLDLVKKCSNVNFTIGTIQNDYYTYFNIKSTQKRYLYVFWITYGVDTIFAGVANQGAIKYNESTKTDSERISIEAKSLLNHFLDYHKTTECNVTNMESKFTRTLEISGTEYRSSYLTDFIKYLFFGNAYGFNFVNNTGRDWEINRQPFFYVNYQNIYQFITNGFRKIGIPTVSGQYETKTGFFLKLCNAMGWDFQITSNFTNELITLEISNRYKPTLAVTASSEDIASINYNTEFNDSNVEYIVILDGLVKSGSTYGTTQGNPVKIVSKDGSYSNNGYFFKNATTGRSYTLYYYEGAEYYMVANILTPGDILQYTKTTYTGTVRNNTIINIENKNILFIDGGENDIGTRIDMASKIITLDTNELGGAAADVVFRGNYGSMLFYRDNNYLRNYDDYSKTDTFKNNFKTLLKSKDSDTIEVVWNKLFTDYYESNYSQIVLNDSNPYLNSTWDITELELDTENEQTKMKLKRVA